MEISAGTAEEQTSEPSQNGIAQVSMQQRHGAGGDAPEEAVAHDELVALAQLGDEGIEMLEVVALVAVAHNDVSAVRFPDSADQRRAVSALRNGRDPCALSFGDLPASVGAAVVCDQHLALDAAAIE